MPELLPAKLDPIPNLDRSLLPAWISDFGMVAPDEVHPDGLIVMTAKGPKDTHHVAGKLAGAVFDDTFWVRYAEPMVNCLGAGLFEAEHPGKTMQTFHWDAARFYGDELTDEQIAMIARRKELTWESPIRVLPD